MIVSNHRGSENTREMKIPRRDWIVLPMLSLMTAGLMVASAEVVARIAVPDTKSDLQNCLVTNDASTGVRGVPNSVCSEEGFEFGRVEYRFNGSGFRTGTNFGSKQPGTFRIVLAGSSMAFGEYVPVEKTVGALLPTELSELTQRNVQLYNEGMMMGFPRSVSLRFADLLSVKPDMILWLLTPFDIEHPSKLFFDTGTPAGKSLTSAAMHVVESSRSGELFEYLIYKSPDSSLKLRMIEAGSPSYLKANMTSELQHHLSEFDGYAADVEGRAKAAGLPVVAVLVPLRAQAAMISRDRWPAGYDPYKLGDEVRSIIESHGGTYIDILPDFRYVPNSEDHFSAIEKHPDAEGHAIIARLIAKELTHGAVPALRMHAMARFKRAQEEEK